MVCRAWTAEGWSAEFRLHIFLCDGLEETLIVRYIQVLACEIDEEVPHYRQGDLGVYNISNSMRNMCCRLWSYVLS